MTRIQAVVFDLDGTLLDSIADLTGAINRSLAACGLPTHTVDECRGYVGGGIREAVRRALPPDSSDELIDRVLALYKNDYPHHCAEQTTWYPGIPELLERLARRGLLLGVLSNKTEATAQQVVKTFFPDVPFRCVLGRAEGRPLKPDPGAAVPVLAAMGLAAGAVAYVGDSGTDMVFARAAGMLPVAAPWGYRSREELAEQGAVLMPACPAELEDLLAPYCGQN